MATIECTYGPVTIDVLGTQYVFAADEFGRFVTTVWIPKHIDVFTAVVAHYRLVNADNTDPYQPPDRPGEVPPEPSAAPVLDALAPADAMIGDPDVTLHCTGSGFTAESIIVFNGGDEPTTFVSGSEVTTLIKPSTAIVTGAFPVLVRNADGQETEPLDFTFNEVFDDPVVLTEISGIGEALANRLSKAGIKDVRQLARLNKKQMAELDDRLELGGRSARDEWLIQAKKLAR